MWRFYNPNPCNVLVGDCTIRACSLITDTTWKKTHENLSQLSRVRCNMPSANVVWGEYLEGRGMVYKVPRFPLTIRQFCREHPTGSFTIGTGEHAVTVIDGEWYDIWDSGYERVLYYFER